MSNLTDLTDFMERELDGTIITNTYGASKVFSVSTPTTLTLGGKKLVQLGEPIAGIVTPRGGSKPVSQPATTPILLDPVEFAVQIPFHKDLLKVQSIGDIASQLAVSATGAIAKSVDTTVFTGEDANAVSAPANFGVLDGVTEKVITDRKSFIEAIKATIAGGRQADSAILSSALWLDFEAATNTNGTPVFNMSGNALTGGTINGIRVITFESATSIGYLGAFGSGSKCGIVSGMDYEVQTQGIVGDGQNAINLNNTNHYSLRVSGLFGFNYYTEDNFVKLTVADNAS